MTTSTSTTEPASLTDWASDAIDAHLDSPEVREWMARHPNASALEVVGDWGGLSTSLAEAGLPSDREGCWDAKEALVDACVRAMTFNAIRSALLG